MKKNKLGSIALLTLVLFGCNQNPNSSTNGKNSTVQSHNPTSVVTTVIDNTTPTGEIQAENGVLYGAYNATGTEYVYQDGQYVEGNQITVVQGMDNKTTNGGASITISFRATAGNYKLKAKLDNPYYFSEGVEPTVVHYSKALDLTQVLKIKVNGNYVNMNNVTLPEIKGASEHNHVWMSFYEEILANVQLETGVNSIAIEGNIHSTLRNKWNEIPVPRFDWFKLEK